LNEKDFKTAEAKNETQFWSYKCECNLTIQMQSTLAEFITQIIQHKVDDCIYSPIRLPPKGVAEIQKVEQQQEQKLNQEAEIINKQIQSLPEPQSRQQF
jgi:hypothetical protein